MKSKKPDPKSTRTVLDYTDPGVLKQIQGLARDGYNDEQIAELLSISRHTLKRHKHLKGEKGKESTVFTALKQGRQPLEVLVEDSVFARARGASLQKTVTKTYRHVLSDPADPDSETIRILLTETIVETHMAPDVGAAMFWLKQRKPEVWNRQPDKVDHTTGGKELGPQIIFADTPLSEKDMAEIRAIKQGASPNADDNPSS